MVGSSGLGPPRVTVRISVRAGCLLPATPSSRLGAAGCGGASWGVKAAPWLASSPQRAPFHDLSSEDLIATSALFHLGSKSLSVFQGRRISHLEVREVICYMHSSNGIVANTAVFYFLYSKIE